MPNDSFEKKLFKIKLMMIFCENKTDQEHNKCQREIDQEQNKLMAELHQTDKALVFLGAKIGVIRTNASKIQSSVLLAQANFNEILSKKDFSISGAITDILWIVASSAIPAAGVALLPLRTLRESPKYVDRFAAEIVRKSGDMARDALKKYKEQREEQEKKNNQPTSNVFEAALLKVQGQLDLADAFANKFLQTLTEGQFTVDFDIQSLWKTEVGTDGYAEEISMNYKELSDYILYQALKAYAQQNCEYVLNPGIKPGGAYTEQNSDTYGRFTGMSKASRYSIYEKFGGRFNPFISKPLWRGGGDYPQISGYRDILRHWKVNIRQERSLSQIFRG